MLYFFILLHFLHSLNFSIALEKSRSTTNYMNVHCRDNYNDPVDWWYLYKPAGDDNAASDDSVPGRNFSFIVSEMPARWMNSDTYITSSENMLQHTLEPIYRGANSFAYLIFDEAKPQGTSEGSIARGILIADDTGGIFISHTVPNLADPLSRARPSFPESELANGHLIVCIDLDITTLNQLALLVRQIGAKTILHIPWQMKNVVPDWAEASKDFDWLKRPDQLEFISGKSALYGIVLYRQPGQLNCLYWTFAQSRRIVLDVYAPLGKQKKNTCEKNYGFRSINAISLKIHDQRVQYLSNRTDKTRFGVSTAAHWQIKGALNPQYWTCTSSLDRDDVTGKGGLLLCIDDYTVWLAFDNLKIKEPECNQHG